VPRPSTIETSALASQFCNPPEPCLSPANPRMTYHMQAEDVIYGSGKVVARSVKFNVFSPAVSTGAFVSVAPNQKDSSTVIQVNSAEFALTPPLGLMVVTLDNPAGQGEAQMIDLQLKK
jgi:hypothetical protein